MCNKLLRKNYFYQFLFCLNLVVSTNGFNPKPVFAQQTPNVDRLENRQENQQIPVKSPLPPLVEPTLFPEVDKLKLPEYPEFPEANTNIIIKEYIVKNSTVFSTKELQDVTKDFTDKKFSLALIQQAANAVTQLYQKKGYLTTGAFVAAKEKITKDGIVTIEVVEGGVEEIRVTGTRRLNPNYIRSRIKLAAGKPLNYNNILEALELLKLDPLIQDIKVTWSTATASGDSLLNVEVKEAKTFSSRILLDNARSPSVGSFRRQLQVTEANLLGIGDRLSVSYTNTTGSDSGELGYTLPLNPRNGTLNFNFAIAHNTVTEPPFDVVDIEADSRVYELSYRQAIVQKRTRELAVGAALTRRESQASVLDGKVPFPARGADEDGNTRLMALRLFQDATWRSSNEILFLRSQLSIGLNIFDSTINDSAPDSEFFAWLGQAQWVKLLAPETVLVLRGDLQFSDRSLLSSEQLGIGGVASVRGYRQDLLLADNGFLASAEVRIPVARFSEKSTLQVAPFIDFGTGWNSSNNPNSDPNTLASVGLGLRFLEENRFSARLDWGIPLISTSGDKRTWQENGIHFSLVYNLF
jgi:hemolysin activation/secretion protein